jgi:TrmH family RNA methyltransferase
MKSISSRQNPLFRRIREAIRDHADEIVIEGPKAVSDAVARGWKPIAIVTSCGTGLRPSSSPAPRQAGGLLYTVAFSDDLFDQLAETRAPQNVIGLFARPHATAADILSRRDTIAVALDGVQDPGNVGTIVRLAAAFDAAGVVLLPGSADAFGPKAIRASAGAILSVPVAKGTARDLIDSTIPLHAADASGVTADPPSRGGVLVFGNEGAGVSQDLLSAAKRIAIPTSGRVESLNVASSAAILLARSFALRNA